MMWSLRDEALLLLEGRGAILGTAREVSEALTTAGVEFAVVGGVATVLHGYVRTTSDVKLFLPESIERTREVLESADYSFNPDRREFQRRRIPVHVLFPDQMRTVPTSFVQINGVRCVALHELIAMKLDSSATDPLRAQDLADVIGLIRANRLTSEFARRLPRPIRSEFRKLAKAIAQRDSKS
jgi:hypothetical protein